MSGRKRDLRLDMARGALIALMVFNHWIACLPRLRGILEYSYRPLGYVSTAEGFFFVSGLTWAQVLLQAGSTRESLRERAARRLGRIYAWQIAISLSVILMSALSPRVQVVVHSMTGAESLAMHLFRALFFLDVPGAFSILPLYIAYLGALAVVLPWILPSGMPQLLGGSAALWLLGQFFVVVRAPGGFQFASFNLLTWQFLFVLGIVLGTWLNAGPEATISGRLGRLLWPSQDRRFRLQFAAATALAVAFLLSRHGILLPRLPESWVGRASLPPVVLLNSLILFYLVAGALRHAPSDFVPATLKPVRYLGRRALEAYSVHVIIQFLLIAGYDHLWPMSMTGQALVLVLAALGLAVPSVRLSSPGRRFPASSVR